MTARSPSATSATSSPPATSPTTAPDREALHALPVNFCLDERSGLTDPRGQIGKNLAVDMHLLTIAATPLRNVLHCIRRCDLELAGVVVVALRQRALAASSRTSRNSAPPASTSAAASTGISIFVRRQMIYADAVRMGGGHVTSDICQGLQVSMQDAERLKTMHGGMIATGLDDREMIELPSILGDRDHDRRQITRAELIGVMRPRVEEILEEVRARLDAAGFEYLRSQRIVLTGGSAQIPGLELVASHVLGRQCRLGKPRARAGPAAVGDRLGLRHGRRPRDARLAPAGRMLGLRNARRPSRRAPRLARAAVVQGQLVNRGYTGTMYHML